MNSTRMLKKVILALFILYMVSSCAYNRVIIDRSAENKILWPGPPERPRIAYVWSISSVSKTGGSLIDIFAGNKGDITDPRESQTLLRPYSVFVDEENNLFIADPGAFRVTVVDLNNLNSFNILSANGKGFISPVGVVSYKGKIYISDSMLRKVFIFNNKGKFIGSFKGNFIRPTCMAIDRKRKKIYLSDTLAHRIYIYDLDGNRESYIGKRGGGDGEFNFPTHLWVDDRGRLYVSDSMNFRVQVFSPDGKFLFKFGKLGKAYGHLEKPKGVATDSDGNIYVVDSINDTVKIFDRQGKLLLFFGEKGTYYGDFWLPSGIFIAKDYIYVADTYNGRVQVFKYLGSGGEKRGEKR